MAPIASMLWFITDDAPVVDIAGYSHMDIAATTTLAQTLADDATVHSLGSVPLSQVNTGAANELAVAIYPEFTVIAGGFVPTSRPQQVPPKFTRVRDSSIVIALHADWNTNFGAFARWENSVLRRSLATDVARIAENEGLPEIFERPFWAGDYPVHYPDGTAPDPQALPFNPVEVADAAGRSWLGMSMLGIADEPAFDRITVQRFAIGAAGGEGESTDSPQSTLLIDEDASEHADPKTPGADESQAHGSRNRIAQWFGFGGSR